MTNLLTALRADLAPLMKRRETVSLRAVRSAIGAIENAEVTYLTEPDASTHGDVYVAGSARFGFAERVVRELDDHEMAAIVRASIDERLEEAVRLRELGRVDQALTLKAEALALTDRLEAYQAA